MWNCKYFNFVANWSQFFMENTNKMHPASDCFDFIHVHKEHKIPKCEQNDRQVSFQKWLPLQYVIRESWEHNNEAFPASSLIEHTQLFRREWDESWRLSRIKAQPSMGAEFMLEKSRFSHESVQFSLQISLPFSEPRHRRMWLQNQSGPCYCQSLRGVLLERDAADAQHPELLHIWEWDELQRDPMGWLTGSSWCHSCPLFYSSSRSSCLNQLPPERACRMLGLSRQGTCGCHLMGEKQVEMKASSRFCQSTSGLLSITPPTLRVCGSTCVWVCASMCILSHWPTGRVCECVHMLVHQCRVCEDMCVCWRLDPSEWANP